MPSADVARSGHGGCPMARIALDHVEKVYAGGVKALDDLNLEVREGEFMVLVGPSGCGKSTALRSIAGLEEISGGTISIGERVVNDLPPKDRDIAMVFQNYALYPHMTVEENLAFGLKLRHTPKEEIRRRVGDAASMLGLDPYLKRKPAALSGGQRQRVAMGRAIVREPQVFLMDEPLSNLDAKLRVQVRADISKLQRDLGVTAIYVTHDQTEAMTMGDRIAVMRDGSLQQVDTPEQVYKQPANQFVAAFIGSPAMNIVEARLTRDAGQSTIAFGEHTLVVGDHPELAAYEGGTVMLGIRPENLEDAELTNAEREGRTITTTCTLREALGSEVLLHFTVGGENLVARVHPETRVREGEQMRLAVDTRRLHFFDPQTQRAI